MIDAARCASGEARPKRVPEFVVQITRVYTGVRQAQSSVASRRMEVVAVVVHARQVVHNLSIKLCLSPGGCKVLRSGNTTA